MDALLEAFTIPRNIMTDFIYVAVIALVFATGGLYAHWCGKL
jgi:hypothetical protein